MDILVEAKKEYMQQLCVVMCPVMIEVFEDLYKESCTMSNGRTPLIIFQKNLKEVPNWSNAMSQQHADNIAKRCAWFNDLLAAVFVSCVKILSSVRLNSENKKLALKLPTNEVFIQTCYNNAAKDLYKDPYVFHEEQNEYLRDDKLTARFSMCIENTVKDLLPVQQILQTYMSQMQPTMEVDDTVQDTPDPEFVEEGAEPYVPEDPMQAPHDPEPVMEETVQEEPGPVSAPEEVPSPDTFANEFKTIHTNTFFEDAPEQRTKKLT